MATALSQLAWQLPAVGRRDGQFLTDFFGGQLVPDLRKGAGMPLLAIGMLSRRWGVGAGV